MTEKYFLFGNLLFLQWVAIDVSINPTPFSTNVKLYDYGLI